MNDNVHGDDMAVYEKFIDFFSENSNSSQDIKKIKKEILLIKL
jgi:hypothetical protein